MFRAALLATVLLLLTASAPTPLTGGVGPARSAGATLPARPAVVERPSPRRPVVDEPTTGATSIDGTTTGATSIGRIGHEPSTSVEGQRRSAAPIVTVHPDDAEHRRRVDEAVARYASAGLRLPDVHVEFSDDGCYGHLGVFERNSAPWRIHVCSDLEFVLTHELGHAWVAATLDQADRDAYVEFRELPAWSDPELHWRERGTEDAAFVLQRVLMTEHPRHDLPAWQELSAAYEQLTGGPPPQRVTVESARTGSSHETNV